MVKTLSKTLLLAVLVGGISGPAHAEPCENAVAAQLEQLQIAPAEVAGITYQRRIRTSRNGAHVVGYEAWVDLAACRGSLVVDFGRRCRIKQLYTRGECRVPGVAAF